jgi:hypothetical protein
MKDIITKINENQLTFPHWKNEHWSEDLIHHLDSLNRENDEMAEIISWFVVKALGETPKDSYKELRKQIDTALV